ncbi:MAG: hypothetical protein WBO46_02220, partial [Caldilineaceae bacterium]
MIRRSLLLLPLLIALLLGTLAASPVHAQQGGIRCTTTVAQSLINTGSSIFFSAEPRSTGDGRVVFFWSTGDLEGNGQNADGNIEIFRSELIFNSDGSVSRTFRQITHSTGSILGGFNLSPDVSADGRFVTFFSDRDYPGSGLSNRDGNFEIFLADLSDLNAPVVRQITNSVQGSNLYPTISDDGRWLAFVSDNGLDPAVAGASPDAERNLDIYLADLSATPIRFKQVTQTALGVLNESPNLSGDGSTLVFASNQRYTDPSTGATVNPEGNLEIFRYVLATGEMTPLTNTSGGVNEMPVINGNGSRVAFVSDQRLDPAVNVVGTRNVFLSPNPATGSGFFQVNDIPGTDNFSPNISADGNRIIYQRLDSAGSQQVVLYDSLAQSRQVFRSRTNPATGEVGAPILSGNGTVLFYEDEGGISIIECSISDLALSADAAPANAVAGDSFVYVWTVSNVDQAIASGVLVQATVPTGLNITGMEPSGACAVNGQAIACNFPRLEVGQSRTMTATVRTGVDALGTLTTAVVASSLTTVDRNPTNNSQSLTTQINAEADLGVTKTASPDTALNGEEIKYTLSISNSGPSLARNVLLTDTLPVGLAFVSSPSCVSVAGQALCALGDMQPGAGLTVTIRTLVTTFQELDIVNQATVASASTADPQPLNNRVSITNSVNTKFDLAVTGSAEPAPLVAGGVITYAYVVTNFGPSAADSVELSVTLPAELQSIGQAQIPAPGSCTTGQVFTCNLGSLPRTQAVTILVTGTISSTYTGPILSLAAVRSTTEANADRNLTNDQTEVPGTVVSQADLSATKSAGSASVLAGNLLTYTLGVANAGPSAAVSVVLSDTLPAGVSITGLATSAGLCTGSSVIACTIASLAPGAQATVTVTVRVDPTTLGTITNTVNVGSPIFDPNTVNNRANVPTLVTDQADMQLVKAASVSFATAGQDSFFYSLSVSNRGPSLARTVLLTDTLPAGLLYTGSTPPAGASCSHSGGVVTCALGDVGAGITQTVRINVSTLASASGSLTNNARLSSSAPDPTPGNTASATVVANRLSDLQVTKRALISNLNVGGTVTYTVNVDNFGPSDATGVVISDVLPAGLTLLPPVSTSVGSYSQGTGLWTAGTVSAGQKVTMTLAATLSPAASGLVITNTALLNALDQTDPVPANNAQFVTFTVPLNADVTLLQRASALTPTVQSLVTLVLTATGRGPETATNVQVVDTLPSQFSFVSQAASRGSYNATTGIWTIGSLGIGQQEVLTLTVRVVGSGSFSNAATISAAEFDSVASDNVAVASFVVAPAADLRLAQTVSAATPNVGDTLFLTVTLANDGPDTASSIQVRDLLSAGMADAFVTPAAGTTYSKTTGLWDVPSLAAGISVSLRISKTIRASGIQSNQAEILASSLPDPDSTPGNGVGNGEDDQTSVTITIPPAADLQIFKTASGGASVGSTVLFNLRVINNGPDTATNIVVTDTLSAALTNTQVLSFGGKANSGNSAYTVATGRWTLPDLAPGEQAILNLLARVDNASAGQTIVDSTEGMRADQYDPVLGNNFSTASFAVQGADLRVGMVVSDPLPNAQEQIVYTVTVTNLGPTATTNVRITDTLPIGFTSFLTQTSAGQFGPASPGVTGVWAVDSLAVSASETLVITGVVAPGTAGQVITNTISGASSSVADGVPANNTSSVSFRVQSADLVMTKQVSKPNPAEDEDISYVLTVQNLGPDVATNVVITDLLPADIQFSTAGSPDYNPTTGAWSVGTVAVNNSSSLLLIVKPKIGSGGKTVVNSITGAKADQEDPAPAINASVTITVVGADLALSKVASMATPNLGDTIFFTATITNNGPYPAGQIIVTDTLPAGLTLVGTPTVSGGSVVMNGSNKIATWTIPNLAIGSALNLYLSASVNAGTGGQSQANTIRVFSAKQTNSATLPDPVASNDSVSATIVPQAADMEVTVVDGPDPVQAGATLLYTVTVVNNGPTAVANFIMTDTIPAGSTFVSATPGCTFASPNLTCSQTTSLAASVSKQYTVAVTYTSVGLISNQATVTTT